MSETELPNQTIYVHNINEKVKKDVLKKMLYMLFSQYGRVIQVVACKGVKMRGQVELSSDLYDLCYQFLILTGMGGVSRRQCRYKCFEGKTKFQFLWKRTGADNIINI